ncbi:hypothetical protein BDW74DRAFT_183789 [Aspergillus multicolor]|uniref:uncharacterized protein n=1 Tax=Aspergillus multicolor TaxID=41759 RepID=UPI003CCC9C99
MEANQEFDFDPTLIGFDATLFGDGFDTFFPPLPPFDENPTESQTTVLECDVADLRSRVEALETENASLRSKLDGIKSYLVDVLIPWTSEVVDALAKPGTGPLSPLVPRS